jgi:hypothetical protein
MAKAAVYKKSSIKCDAHAITIVGYDDEIWFDTDEDGLKDIMKLEPLSCELMGKDWDEWKRRFFLVPYNLIKNSDFVIEASEFFG